MPDLAPTWVTAPGVRERTIAVAEAAAQVWGGADFGNVTIRWVYVVTDCGGNGSDIVLGCTREEGYPWDRETTISVTPMAGACPEATALAHEIGHVALGAEHGHDDPRWRDAAFWQRMIDALAPLTPDDPWCQWGVAMLAAWH